MKNDKAWLIQKVSDIFWRVEIDDDFNIQNANIMFDDISNLIDQLDEPEKPVIPKFVADYIELNKGWSEDRQEYIQDDNSGLWFALDGNSYGMPNSVSDWLFNEEKVETFAKAWLDGYKVEKEPHYYVAFEGEFNLLYVTHVDIYGEDGKFNYRSVFDKKHALKFTDKSKAEYLADFLGAIVVEVTE